MRLIRKYTPVTLRFFRGMLSAPLPTALEIAIKCLARFTVQSGPFRGMKFHSIDAFKLLGTYEMELHPVIERLRAREFAEIINIGGGEGYYAVGLARLFPAARIHVFEAGDYYRDMLGANARSNGVAGAITIAGRCSPEDVRAATAAAGPRLVVVDVEGAEVELLDPAIAPGLAASFILVETHEMFVPGSTELLRARFLPTHRIHEYAAEPRAVEDFPLPSLLPRALSRSKGYRDAIVRTMTEPRIGPQSWLLMEPLNGDSR